jgi:hypothetical protein
MRCSHLPMAPNPGSLTTSVSNSEKTDTGLRCLATLGSKPAQPVAVFVFPGHRSPSIANGDQNGVPHARSEEILVSGAKASKARAREGITCDPGREGDEETSELSVVHVELHSEKDNTAPLRRLGTEPPRDERDVSFGNAVAAGRRARERDDVGGG